MSFHVAIVKRPEQIKQIKQINETVEVGDGQPVGLHSALAGPIYARAASSFAFFLAFLLLGCCAVLSFFW